ncbi:MAG: c-type cytochrome [Bacteriovoracaceae bacterium]|nr:c-type cytochrome [Bacteriovoracaceae bacterium]
MKREPGMAYNMKTLNKVFAVLSIVFMFATVWMVLDDYIRPWKAVQVKALEIKKKVLLEKVKAEETSIDGEKVKAAQEAIVAAEAEIAKNEENLKELNSKLSKAVKAVYVQNMYKGVVTSQKNATQYKFEHAEDAKDKSGAKKYKAKFDELVETEKVAVDELKAYQQTESQVRAEITKSEEALIKAKKEMDDLVGAKERLLTAIAQTDKNPVWLLRNSPFIDYLDPTVKITQYVINKVHDDRYFQAVPRVDRCTTCHVFIDQKGFEDQPQPYKTHPNIDALAVGENSAHPIKEFGCTSCHQGEGHRVNDFNAVVHTPRNEEQKKEWMEKYHWHEPHKIPQPMYRTQDTEAACIKCHKDEVRLSFAPRHNEGRELIETYGCYGCHKIDGIAGWKELPKPGPSLAKIKGKTNKEFLKNWIWSPHTYNPKSKMPAFFNQANNSNAEFQRLNIAEVNSMAEYIWSKSADYAPFKKFEGGNKEKGKQLVQTIGCLGCHEIAGVDAPYDSVKAKKASYLSAIGSKVNPDWLVSWLKKPSHYDPTTIMPSFRLSDRDANDIASYLLSFKNTKFEQMEFTSLDKQARDELLLEYFSQFDTMETANANLAKLSDEERTHELGYRSIGKYGCYSCHNIQGFEPDRAPIGPELTKVGSKPVEQFGFGHQKIEHSRHAWIEAHLEQPSRWDIGVPKPFKDLTKMPNFYLEKEEIQAITTYLVGLVGDKVPLLGQNRLSANKKLAQEGKAVAVKYNCQGCHKIDDWGGYITKAYEDDLNQGPPYLVKEGHRVQTDWLYDFLRNVHPIRSYVKVRMPTFNFSTDEINKLIAYFQADADQGTFVEMDEYLTWEPGEKEAAKKLWNDLACVTCHTGGFNNETPQAPNLHFAKKRLRPTWIQKWLTNPSAMMEYTVMPNFWENGTISASEGVLGDDPQRQIRALTKYILEFSYDRNPQPWPKDGQ